MNLFKAILLISLGWAGFAQADAVYVPSVGTDVQVPWATANTTDATLAGGNVGIGTIKTTTSALTVMNGNVGIGTWKPNRIFTVSPNANNVFTIDTPIAYSTGVTVNAANGAYSANLPMELRASSFNLSQGNVGIGTITTYGTGGTNLEVHSNNGSADAGISMSTPTTTSGNYLGEFDFMTTTTAASDKRGALIASQLTAASASNPTADLEFYTANGAVAAERMRIVASGNVGIGSFVPGSVLDVNGSIRSTASGNSYFNSNLGIGTTVPPNPLYVVGTPMFTTGVNIGIGTASPQHLCISNNAVSTCL